MYLLFILVIFYLEIIGEREAEGGERRSRQNHAGITRIVFLSYF